MSVRPIRKTLVFETKSNLTQIIHPSWTLEIGHVAGFRVDHTNALEWIESLPKIGNELSTFISQQSLWDFSSTDSTTVITSDTLVQVCRACANEWYGILYSHPWWEVLAHSASVENLKKWILQNYALSRIAARSSAQAIISGSPNESFFLNSIIEEFDHHNRYFRQPNQELGISDRFYDQEPPLGVRALEYYLSWLASTDQLALIIFYFFQESSAYLSEDFQKYYDHLEAKYKLPGFFDGWMRHVQEDFSLSHSEQVENALISFGEVLPNELEVSLMRAWMCIVLLIADYENFAKPTLFEHVKLNSNVLNQWIIKQASLLGLSIKKDNSDIYFLGKVLKDITSSNLIKKSNLTDWQTECQTVLKLLGGNEPKFLKVMVNLFKDNNPITYQDHKIAQFAANIEACEPPQLLSGGRYNTLSV